MILLGRPGNGKLTFFRFVLVLINSIILSFSSFMFFYLTNINDNIKEFSILYHGLLENHIKNSIQFLIYILHKIGFGQYLYIVIMTFIFVIIELRSTIWAGEDDRIIL